jgi:hypothetical protein
VLTDLRGDVNAAAGRIGQELLSRHAIAAGATIVLVSINPDPSPGSSNFLKLERVVG